MTERLNIENKIKAVSDTTTEADLSALKTELSANCLAPEKLTSLRAIIEAKNNIREETKVKLRNLLTICQSSIESKESNDTFSKVFEGTKSEMLNKEHIQTLKGYILTKFEKFTNLNPSQRDNLATATIDRLLSDKTFTGIVGDVSGGITGAVKTLEKRGITGVFSAFSSESDDKKPDSKEATETKEKVESSVTGIMKRIQELIDSATTPLVELLKKKPAGLDAFLSNPKEIASYNGSGTIRADVVAMSDSEKTEYIKNLNKRVLEVDGKIISLEGLREKGMDFVATAPNWMQDIFKWLLSLPFIGNLLASFLGYKNGTEALSGMGEELRQRKSIMALREFRTINPDNTKYEGKYSGKIDILKGKDLSKIERKKLVKFFKFTAEEGINTTSPEFWLSLFHDKKLTVKDAAGKDVVYAVDLTKEDLDDGFKGLYQKLNGVLDQKKKRDYSEQLTKEAATEKQEKNATEQKRQAELATNNGEIARYSEEERVLKSYSNLYSGEEISNEVQKLLSGINLQNLSDGKYLAIAQKALSSKKYDSVREYILAELYTLGSVINGLRRDNKFEGFLVQYKNFQTNAFDKGFANIFAHRRELLAALGYTDIYLATPGKKLATLKQTTETKKQADGPVEKPKEDGRTVLVKKAFEKADSLPFQFGTETVKFEGGNLVIGTQKFALKLSDGGFISPSVSNIELVGADVKLGYFAGEKLIPRSEIIAGIGDLLTMKTNSVKEISGNGGKLIITSVA